MASSPWVRTCLPGGVAEGASLRCRGGTQGSGGLLLLEGAGRARASYTHPMETDDEIWERHIARLGQLPADDPVRIASLQLVADVDQAEARGLELMQRAETREQGREILEYVAAIQDGMRGGVVQRRHGRATSWLGWPNGPCAGRPLTPCPRPSASVPPDWLPLCRNSRRPKPKRRRASIRGRSCARRRAPRPKGGIPALAKDAMNGRSSMISWASPSGGVCGSGAAGLFPELPALFSMVAREAQDTL